MAVNGFLVDGDIQKYNYESLENYNTPNFSSSSTYEVGDYVMYQGKLYKCITEITTSGGWDSSKWSLAILSDDVANLRSSVESGEYGLSELVKQAILQIARKVAYIDDQGQTYYDALYDALYPLNVASISAVYTQSGTVYNSDSLDSLKPDLVVTATYTDSSTATVDAADYTLSGALTVGTSTITVSYGGKTATFSVTVTSDPVYEVYTIGTPSISGNILTPGDSGMIRTNRVFSPGGSSWKIRVGLTTGTVESSGIQDVIGSIDSSGVSQRSALMEGAWYSDPGVYRIGAFLSGNGTSWNINQGTVVNELSSNTTYLVEIEFTGTQYTIRSSTDDGTTWTTISTSGSWPSAINSTTAIKPGYYLGIGLKRNGYWQGTIDLTKVKVWVNGTLWWSPVLGV